MILYFRVLPTDRVGEDVLLQHLELSPLIQDELGVLYAQRIVQPSS